MNPFPGRKSVVIMNNCTTHDDDEIHKLIIEDVVILTLKQMA